ncbi:DUF3472 domain-containing protein [Pseudomonas synxantha]|uniref:Uncharacterized protein n=1 Tax=Pseudomonas synxantha TaxID=47883 RepID=A0ACC6JL60_9PSED|nr:DUF3472 domain-containing protein [Pseudomonas synxantha]MDR6606955.1 hypothetical protein [Pseudomonas synxantha]
MNEENDLIDVAPGHMKENYSFDVSSGTVPTSGPYISSAYAEDKAELIYIEQCIPLSGDAKNIYWSTCNFYFNERGGYAGLQNNAGRITGGNRYEHNNICSVWDLVETDPSLPPEVTLDYAVEGLYSDHFGGEGTGLHTSHFMPWSVDQWYAMVIRRWYVEGENVTRMAMFMYSYEVKVWTHYMSASIPGRDLPLTGTRCSGFLERFGGGALGYHGITGQHFRMSKDGSWQKPLFYESAAGGNTRSWNAELVNGNTAVKVIAGGDFNNSESFKKLYPTQVNDKPGTAVKAGVEWMRAELNSVGAVAVDWRIVESAPPQLSYVIKIYEGNTYGPVVCESRDTIPEKRSAVLAVDPPLRKGTYAASLVFTDIFNQESNFGYVSFQVP